MGDPSRRIVITRMRHDQATRDYVSRRLAEDKTMGEIARILKPSGSIQEPWRSSCAEWRNGQG
jgi:hypothetical protein